MSTHAYINAALVAAFFSGVIILLFVLFPKLLSFIRDGSDVSTVAIGLCAAVTAVACALLLVQLWRLGKVGENWLGESAAPLQEWIQSATPQLLRLAIVVVAALTLFLELVLIRWQASLFPVFALYKNFTLLACFCGLGIGYALARTRPLLLPICLPMFAFTLLLLTLLRYGTDRSILSLLYVVPVQEETAIFGTFLYGEDPISWLISSLPVYLLLIGTFALNTLMLLPAGQFCGAMMECDKPLISYGCNLLGSIIGVALLFLLSWLWIGPVIWFGAGAAVLLWYQLPSPPARKMGLVCGLICLVTTAWPVEPLVQNIYSPYQLIQKVTKYDGLMQILASGSYYQRVYDFSLANASREGAPAQRRIIGYYELPFHTAASLHQVAIVGAGSGNDVAAALRSGAENVYAVEIDPAIRNLGLLNHPEHPYSDPRVHSIVDDARTFFRGTPGRYDTIVYGVLDSHILLSHGSNVRLDSFVYTQEGLSEAFAHLDRGGLMSVSFALLSRRMGDKIFRILKTLPGAGAPVAILTGYDSKDTTTFMVSKDGDVKLPLAFMDTHQLADVTPEYQKGSDEAFDLPTDDWPFFYMDAKMYPASYVVSLVLVLLLALQMVRMFLPHQRWQAALVPFFFLGSGFMLVETKAITELGLLYGNTWHVVGIAIMSVLIMAFFANLLAVHLPRGALIPAYLLLLGVTAAGYLAAIHGGIGAEGILSKLATVTLLTSPLLFSGIVFSTLLKVTDNIAGAMSYNLMGAMLGGLLEYNSMQFGFAFLYLLAFALYALACATSRWHG